MPLPIALAALPLPAPVQTDPRLQAQYEVAAILASARHDWQSPLGWQEDVFSTNFQVRGPCESTITRTQREIRRGDKYINQSSRSTQIDWRYVTSVQPARFNDSGGSIGIAILYVGDLRTYAVPNVRDQERALAALGRLITACKAPPPRPAAPVAAATPRPAPAPQPAPAPKTGFYYVDRAAGHCESYRVRRLLIAGDAHATAHIQARGTGSENRLVLSQGGIATRPPTQAMDNNIFLLTRSAPDAKLSASIDFDGRAAGTFSVSGGYGSDNGGRQRRIYLPADFLDRLATVQVMTVTLKSGRTVTDTYVFDVASARFIRPDLARMNWRCTGAD